MNDIHDINSILNAVNEINLKKKNKNINSSVTQNFIPKVNQNLEISPNLNQLILEAEEYKKKLIINSPKVVSTKIKNVIKNPDYDNKIFEDVKTQIIEDLYSKLKKKVKKNSLKIIFNLHLKIKDLENSLKNSQDKKEQFLDDNLISKKKQPPLNLEDINVFKQEVITSLEIQDASIEILNKKVINFKRVEETLRLQIIDLEQDKTILLNKIKKFDELQIQQNDLNDTKEKLIAIYKQVEKQKMIFLDLKNHSAKIEQNSNFFKENYEKLIIENNDVKKRLIIAKEQISVHESNKRDLLLSINQLNEISSKSNIALKISPPKLSSEENILKLRKKFEITE